MKLTEHKHARMANIEEEIQTHHILATNLADMPIPDLDLSAYERSSASFTPCQSR